VLGVTLAARNRDLEERAASAAALRRVSIAITALVDLPEILDAIVGHARGLLAADVAVLLLAEPDGTLRLAASDLPDRLGAPRARRLAEDGDDMARFVPPELRVSRLVAPLQHGRETTGMLAIGCRRARAFDVDDVETLASLADQATIAIEHARLQARLRDLAVETERERIAREMHDGLAQVLGYVNTKSQAVEQLLAAGRVDDARARMAELSAAARSLYVDIREAILGLRSPITPGLGLAGAIADYAERFAEAAKIRVGVEVSPAARAIHLEPDVEAQIFRIVQESLTNVRKHAAASRVSVRLELVDDVLELQLADDGRGFAEQPTNVDGDWPRYGLAAMRERAAAMGARLFLADRAEGGTTVMLKVPVAAATRPR
jgi:signal transduction histidine kinase